jgi:GNAT superfamily N-acetyltransferase
LVQKAGHKEMVAIGTYAEDTERRAEVAFVVREDHQGLGIASHLLQTLERIARRNGFRGFRATVLSENVAMLRVFKKRYPSLQTVTTSGGEVILEMDFDQ